MTQGFCSMLSELYDRTYGRSENALSKFGSREVTPENGKSAFLRCGKLPERTPEKPIALRQRRPARDRCANWREGKCTGTASRPNVKLPPLRPFVEGHQPALL
jgi:hypothetical protein